MPMIGNQSLLYSASQYEPYEDPGSRFTNYFGAAGLTTAALVASTQIRSGSGSGRLIDEVYRKSRRIGYSSPGALLNTFRVSEFLSPFTGAIPKNLERVGDTDVFKYVFDEEMISNRNTISYLETEFSAEMASLKNKLKIPDLSLLAGSEHQIVYETMKNDSTGKLFLESKGERLLISDQVQLLERSPFDARSKHFGTRLPLTNPAGFAYMQANGFTEQFDTARAARQGAESVFASREVLQDGTVIQSKSQYLPIRRVSTNKALVYPRSLFAFGMDRFNRLLETATEQLPILNRMSSALEAGFGSSLTVKPGKASNMFLRFGIKASKIGAVGIGIKEMDYWRQETGMLGQLAFSGITSYAGSKLIQKMNFGMKTATANKIGMALFAGQMLLPGFDQGIGAGVYTAFKNADIARAAVGEVTLMSSYRRTLEGLLPGVSDWKTGAFVGLSVALASGFGGTPISARIFEKLDIKQKIKLGISKSVAMDPLTTTPLSVRGYQKMAVESLFSRQSLPASFPGETPDFLSRRAGEIFGSSDNLLRSLNASEIETLTDVRGKTDIVSRKRLTDVVFAAAERIGGKEGVSVMHDELALRYDQALAVRKSEYVGLSNKMNQSFLDSLQEIDVKYHGKDDIFSKGLRSLETMKSSFIHSFFGASKVGEEFTEAAATAGYKTKFGRYGTLFLGGMLAHQVLTGGLLGSMETPGELDDVYSGRKLVEIRRGRWWEGGGSSFEGKNISYFRPHNYVLYMSGATDEARYKVNRSPIHNFILENFTYQLERENYYDRPYPITGAAFQNVPIIGGLLSATIGRVIKPPKLMHVNEYMRANAEGEIEFAHRNEYKGPSGKLGGSSPGKPMSPFSASFIAGELQYQFRELEGLTGYASNVYTKMLTGEETFGIQRPVLESAGKMFSARDDFWKMQLGGGFFTTEPIRRFLPRERSTIQQYNPILNEMPSWLPDRFKFGDPYRNLEYGEVRLPGAGYAAIHPELKGINPESYPDIFKYSILADVAPHSREFIMLREKMYSQRAQGMLDPNVEKYMDEVDRMANEKLSYHTTREIDRNAYDLGPIGDVTRGAAGFAKRTIRKGLAPAEYMIPMGFRPSQKLLNDPNYMSMDPIERYEYERLYGTENAFWDKPIRDWFRPAFYSTMNLLGYEGTPGYRQKANETNEYFDKLEFMQQMLIAQRAEAQGDTNTKRKALYKASKTAYGVNPQAHAMGIYEALPEGEKAYFDLFAEAKGAERERILEMIPEDNRALYQSLWSRMDSNDPSLYPGSKVRIDEEYMYQQFANLQNYFNENPMPATDWVGWHEDVEMDDIKVRYADREGIDLGDLDMYDQRRRLQSRMGYLNNSEDYLFDQGGIRGRSNLGTLLRASGRGQMNTQPFDGYMNYVEYGNSTTANFTYTDSRSGVLETIMGALNGF